MSYAILIYIFALSNYCNYYNFLFITYEQFNVSLWRHILVDHIYNIKNKYYQIIFNPNLQFFTCQT